MSLENFSWGDTEEPIDETIKFSRNFIIGLILIPVSLIVLLISQRFTLESSEGFSFLLINYVISVIYFLLISFSRYARNLNNKSDRKHFTISLTLFAISSFTLNNVFQIFSSFPLWVTIYLSLFFIAFLGFCLIEYCPLYIKNIIYFFLGAGLIIITYFAVYLFSFYPIGFIGLILFGISIHLYVPLIILLFTFINYYKQHKTISNKVAFSSGLLIPLIITVTFLIQWNKFNDIIHETNASYLTQPDKIIPEWVALCQQIPSHPFAKMIVEGSLVYDTFKDFWGGWNNTVFDDVKKHDPLVNAGIALLKDLNMDDNTRIKILKSQYNARHLAQRKLWSGRELETIEVLNNIKIMPDYRLSYTEKIISIKNVNMWDRNQQEAAYTFYLPEGSVATSLSLWINGKEEPSRLTTKEKADSAYTNIVGIERRDPALLHWQEGNTLTVTVFPCTPQEIRKFKIGITSPLRKENNQLTYNSIYFDGPVAHKARETSILTFESSQALQISNIPSGFKKSSALQYIYKGTYSSDWNVECSATNLSNAPFSFNNKTYTLSEKILNYQPFQCNTVYLDLNSSWSYAEYTNILKAFNDRKVYAINNSLIEINISNKDTVFKKFKSFNFSLFPFYKIISPQNSLVITRSNELSPNLSDLEGSLFEEKISRYFNKNRININIYQIGSTISPYLKTLKEFQLFNYADGTIDNLNHLIKNNTFVKANINKDQIELSISDVVITRTNQTNLSAAPDHLFRLFAYNKIMKDVGRNFFDTSNGITDSAVALANEAYIVSPLSSLIVLETKQDYDRFDIAENANSLKNATMHSSGAVPEPEEWLLIVMVVLVAGTLFIKSRNGSVSKC
jgi:XrtN system VIT domain protein